MIILRARIFPRHLEFHKFIIKKQILGYSPLGMLIYYHIIPHRFHSLNHFDLIGTDFHGPDCQPSAKIPIIGAVEMTGLLETSIKIQLYISNKQHGHCYRLNSMP